jgi:hypothetical protein
LFVAITVVCAALPVDDDDDDDVCDLIASVGIGVTGSVVGDSVDGVALVLGGSVPRIVVADVVVVAVVAVVVAVVVVLSLAVV